MSARSYNVFNTKSQGIIRVRTEGTRRIVRLHATDVLDYNSSTDEVKLYTGGWTTPTTLKAINNGLAQLNFLNVRLVQRKHTLYLLCGTTDAGKERLMPFIENMFIKRNA